MWISSFYLLILIIYCLHESVNCFVRFINANGPCNIYVDTMLLLDSMNNNAYYRCASGSNIGISGRWHRYLCPPRTVFNFVNQKCTSIDIPLKISIINNSCANGQKCIGGSICDPIVLKCLCPTNTVIQIETLSCVPLASINKKITEDSKQIFLPFSSRPAAEISTQSIQSQLQKNPDASNFDLNQLFTKFASVALPGRSCASGETCLGGAVCFKPINLCLCPEESIAHNGVCTTFKNHAEAKEPIINSTKFTTININELKSYKKNGPGKPCDINTDCMIGAFCNGNSVPPTCKCLSTHVDINGICEQVYYPGQQGCRYDLQCSKSYSEARCLGGSCVCPNGQKAVEQTCVGETSYEQSPPGGSCIAWRKCTGGSVCRDGWCVCPQPTMIVFKGVCMLPAISKEQTRSVNSTVLSTVETAHSPVSKLPGDSCGPFDECVGGSICLEGICICPAGTIHSKASASCEKTTNEKLQATMQNRPGEKCAPQEFCMGGSYCSKNEICTCPPEKPFIVGYLCVEKPNLSENTNGAETLLSKSCDEMRKCSKNFRCVEGQCQCDKMNDKGECLSTVQSSENQASTLVIQPNTFISKGDTRPETSYQLGGSTENQNIHS